MKLAIPLLGIKSSDGRRVGGKASTLGTMLRQGMNVPGGLCITTEAYERYVIASGLRERIFLELARKDYRDMRWEEMWDASLRIRNMFLNTPIPENLAKNLAESITTHIGEKAVAVRSSAPGEDSAGASFAGLHESYVNVRGSAEIVAHIRLVWASLWSDAAMLYRQELGLDIEHSTMAVVVQDVIEGECSGVIFTRDPNDERYTVVEGVHGLNQGLVDGTVEPDRWLLNRETGDVISHSAANREHYVTTSVQGVRLIPLPDTQRAVPPLRDDQVRTVYQLAMQAERLFGCPQDMEWTVTGGRIAVLQARPITTLSETAADDQRRWYLSLRRSFENLRELRREIEEVLIPQMAEEAKELGAQDLNRLPDDELAEEIQRRSQVYRKWVDVYWTEFIPFAHGVRLFGQVYNDAVQPKDPYEFVDLLAAADMVSIRRNRMLEELASMIRENPGLVNGPVSGNDRRTEFDAALDVFMQQFGDLSCGAHQCTQGRDALMGIVHEMAMRSPRTTRLERDGDDLEVRTERFLGLFEGEKRQRMADLLDLARASYRLRDDDNIHLGRIEAQLNAALDAGKQRLRDRGGIQTDGLEADDVTGLLVGKSAVSAVKKPMHVNSAVPAVRPRQLRGQPAGPGIARGKAHVILDAAHLLEFKAGEVLICDAIDPTLTFVVPLAAGIVERRGGMLIHGAIIAREYGLPCVTGVPELTRLVTTGDLVTVDGYLGIVTIGETVDADLED
jgi:pyruvate,water dikinase